MDLDIAVVKKLIAAQFPQWSTLPIHPVAESGWDNRTFHLGNDLSVRMPSAEEYASQVEKEQKWLPKLAPSLPLPIPVPVAMGKATADYPYPWSIYRWLEGESLASTPIIDMTRFAKDLATFLGTFQKINIEDGPLPGWHNFHRGGLLSNYDDEVREALSILKDRIDTKAAWALWDKALATHWMHTPVWVHGDVSAGNLLVKADRLCAVIDFGQLAIGDPACDLAMTWTFFSGESRAVFQNVLALDNDTWLRGRAWVLWKALIIAAGLVGSNAVEGKTPFSIIETVLESD